MAGNLIQVRSSDGLIRVKDNGPIVSGVSDPCCCCACWIKLSSTFDCDALDWLTPTITVKQTATPTDPTGRWYTTGDTGVGCTAYYWKCISSTAECDTLSVGDEYTGAGEPSGIDTAACCDEDPGDPGEPPADGTTCATDSRIFTTFTGFSIDHTCKTVYTCSGGTNTANGTARILNGTSGVNYAGFLHPNGTYVGSPIDFPRSTPGGGAGTLAERSRRAALSWSVGDPNSCDDAFGGFGTLGSGATVEVTCGDPNDQIRVRILFPFPQNECTAVGYAFDSGWVSTPKSNGLRKTVTVSDSAGDPNIFLTNGTVSVSYCCDP
jgi:hypothetical protein